MNRPAHVRCENCCYYRPKTLDAETLTRGLCCIRSRSRAKYQEEWCGEFSAEWPEPPVYDWDNPAHRPIIERMMHPLIQVKLKDDGDIETAEYVKELRKAYGKKDDEEDVPST